VRGWGGGRDLASEVAPEHEFPVYEKRLGGLWFMSVEALSTLGVDVWAQMREFKMDERVGEWPFCVCLPAS
jgi:hypothetical protein